MEAINYIGHLNGVFGRFSKDGRLNPTHVSLYMGLFHFWNSCYFRPEFHINRAEVMQISKIGSTATYHRCIKELSHWGYMLYQPSHNPFKGSKIKMFNFDTSPEQVANSCRDQNETSAEQALIPINKHIQTLKNKKNIDKRENFKNKNPFEFQTMDKPAELVQFRDNLKTGEEKNYGEPL